MVVPEQFFHQAPQGELKLQTRHVLKLGQKNYPWRTQWKELMITSHTAVNWNSSCREACADICIPTPRKIGGPDHIVECRFTKKHMKGQWDFCGIDKGTGECFLNVVSETLPEVIKKRILPGTVLQSGCWEKYKSLGRKGYQKETLDNLQKQTSGLLCKQHGGVEEPCKEPKNHVWGRGLHGRIYVLRDEQWQKLVHYIPKGCCSHLPSQPRGQGLW